MKGYLKSMKREKGVVLKFYIKVDKPNLFIDETSRLVGKNWISRCFQAFCAVAKIEKHRALKHILIWGVAWFLLILYFTEAWVHWYNMAIK